MPGRPSFFQYTLKNPFAAKCVFTIAFSDPDQEILGGESEISLVKNEPHQEWEFWFDKGECSAPPFWDMVRPNNEILLKPNEEVPLLFKFLTFREVGASKASPRDCIKPRSIKIVFNNSINKEVTSISLQVNPQNPPVDISLNFHEPQNSQISLSIPCDFRHRPEESFCSRTGMLVEFDEDDRLRVEARTGPEMTSESFYIFIYGERF